MELHLIRHTTVAVEKGVIYGHSDVETGPTYATEAAAIARLLPATAPDKIYSSPLSRCYKLAYTLAAPYGIPVTFDDRLKELDFGQWEMKTWETVDQQVLTDWMKNFVELRTPGGENFIDLQERIRSFRNDLHAGSVGKAWIITHAGPIRAWLSLEGRFPLNKAFEYTVEKGAVEKLVY